MVVYIFFFFLTATKISCIRMRHCNAAYGTKTLFTKKKKCPIFFVIILYYDVKVGLI